MGDARDVFPKETDRRRRGRILGEFLLSRKRRTGNRPPLDYRAFPRVIAARD